MNRRINRQDNLVHSTSILKPPSEREAAQTSDSSTEAPEEIRKEESHPSNNREHTTFCETLPAVGLEVHKTQHKPGRDAGDSNIPDFLRHIIASAANQPGTTQAEVAQAFGIHPHTVHDYAHGRVNDTVQPDLLNTVKKTKDIIHEKALDRVVAILNLFDDDDVSRLEPKEKAKSALALSKVAESMKDKQHSPFGEARVIIMAPEQRNEAGYKVIDVTPDPAKGKR